MQRILHLEQNRYSKTTLSHLKDKFEVDYLDTESQSELYQHLENNSYTAIFTKLGLAMDQRVMELQSDLQYIVTPTTGLNHIDLSFAKKQNINVLSLKGETELLKRVRSTAEHTWLILLALVRNLPAAFQDVKDGYWRRVPFLAEELDGKTLGIIGYGRLGRIVASYAKPFHMRVIATDIDPTVFETKDEHVESVDLKTLLRESDVVSLHIPSNDQNAKFLNKEKISQMKSSAVLINTSRGEVVDENALLEALNNKSIAGAATDVIEGDSTWEGFSTENHPLIEYAKENSNLIITPHMGGYGRTSIERTRDFITKKFLKHIL